WVRPSSSSVNALTVCSAILRFTRRASAVAAARLVSRPPPTRASAEPARNIILRARVTRVGEDFFSRARFYKLAQVEKRSLLRDASRLGHRVRDDDDAVIFPELIDELFDLGGGD